MSKIINAVIGAGALAGVFSSTSEAKDVLPRCDKEDIVTKVEHDEVPANCMFQRDKIIFERDGGKIYAHKENADTGKKSPRAALNF